MLHLPAQKEDAVQTFESKILKVLIITADIEKFDYLYTCLKDISNFCVVPHWHKSPEGIVESIAAKGIDLCILEKQVDEYSAPKLIEDIQETNKTLPFIVLSDDNDERFLQEMDKLTPVVVVPFGSMELKTLEAYIDCAIKLGKQCGDMEVVKKDNINLIAYMAHELRTPLNAVIGFSDLIINDVHSENMNSEHMRYIEIIRRTGNHLNDIIGNTLLATKAALSKISLNDETLDLYSFIGECVETMMPLAIDAKVDLYYSVPQELPNIVGDSCHIQRVLFNLISNALKFTSEGGSVTIEAMMGPEGDIIVNVVDTGIGMSSNDIPKAFAPYEQISGNTKHTYEGTGLGLPISKTLMESHGGSLEVESEVGLGTKVILNFPSERTACVDNLFL